MKKRQSKNILSLPKDTMIEVIATSPGEEPIKKEMTINEADQLPNRKKWKYQRFQLGFSQFNLKSKN